MVTIIRVRRGQSGFSDSTKIKNESTINIYVGDLDPNHARTPIINRINPIIIKMILRNTTTLEDSKNLAEPVLLEYSIKPRIMKTSPTTTTPSGPLFFLGLPFRI